MNRNGDRRQKRNDLEGKDQVGFGDSFLGTGDREKWLRRHVHVPPNEVIHGEEEV